MPFDSCHQRLAALLLLPYQILSKNARGKVLLKRKIQLLQHELLQMADSREPVTPVSLTAAHMQAVFYMPVHYSFFTLLNFPYILFPSVPDA